MLVTADGRLRAKAKPLGQEAKELNLRFSAILRNATAWVRGVAWGIESSFAIGRRYSAPGFV